MWEKIPLLLPFSQALLGYFLGVEHLSKILRKLAQGSDYIYLLT